MTKTQVKRLFLETYGMTQNEFKTFAGTILNKLKVTSTLIIEGAGVVLVEAELEGDVLFAGSPTWGKLNNAFYHPLRNVLQLEYQFTKEHIEDYISIGYKLPKTMQNRIDRKREVSI